MKTLRWLAWALAAVTVAAGIVASCGIDDEVVWISGDTCTGSCTDPHDDYACDVDLSCTAGCPTDWDCTEGEVPDDGADADADAAADTARDAPSDGTWSDLGGGPDAEEDATDPVNDSGTGEQDAELTDDGNPGLVVCSVVGGGTDSASAESLVVGLAQTGRVACPTVSQWFRFDLAAGERFSVAVSEATGPLSLRVYAGSPLAAVAGADLAADGSFAATAGATGRFYLRVRSLAETTVSYTLLLARPER